MKPFRCTAGVRTAALLLLATVLLWAPAGAETNQEPRTLAGWMDRGALLSSYGNYEAAIQSYQKALALAPGHPDALFQMGVCYGELRMLDRALAEMSRAIEAQPGVGAFHYGRGRVYLLTGDREKAMADFMEAGVLGHPDARAFLEDQSGVQWE